ncbi:MAG: SusC/RagA family TonB-linked outer membrane protein [Bacteroidetes bacterium]|nr:MAG: SusC/RagA family TonB-linked outer membrane protein [Bacteroidota bacterium]
MKRCLLFLLALCFASVHLMAQKEASGTVTGPDGTPLVGASVLVKGTTIGVFTDENGSFKLSLPEGSNTIVVSYVGYASQDVVVGESGTVNVSLQPDDLTLDEVVITSLGIRKEKKALGYGVSTISTGDIALRSEADVARILRGKTTGVDITQTSGLAGSGTNVIIRGYSSITGNNQPLFVIDGVPFNSDANSDQSFVTGGATASSRFLDLDPNNIAEITILKGLSATVLYGEAGRNGVVLITTKNGNAGQNTNKKMEVSFSQQVGFTQVANLPEYQNTYGNGFSGNFGWFFSNWGPAFDVRGSNGIAEDGTVEHPYDQDQYHDDFPEFIGVRYPYKPYKSVENFFQTGNLYNTSVGLEAALGNNSAVSANYSYLNDNGFVPADKNTYERQNFGLGARTKLSNGLTLSSTFNYVNSDRLSPPAAVGFGSNPSGASLFANLVYTPRSIDLLNLPYQSPIDGSQVYYRRGSAIQNPLWTLHNAFDTETIRRFFGNFQLSYDLTNWLSLNYRIGIDQYTQQNRRAINKGGSQVPDGQYMTSERLNRITDHVLNFQYDHRFNDDLEIDGIVGLNLRRETRDFTRVNSTNQFVFGLLNHSNFTDHVATSASIEENNIGVYGTATVGYGGFIYLNLQARNDWTSTLEKANRSVFYPSASLSFVPTDAIPALRNNPVVNYIKMRVGYGTSAGYPNPYQTRNVLITRTNRFVTPGGTVMNINSVDDQRGNPNLGPELHSELEFGLEARFLQNRIGIDLSLYDKESNDLIIALSLDPATGYDNTTVNAASVENKGIELGLNLVPFAGEFRWSIDVNFTKNVNNVLKIAEGVDQIPIAGYSNLGNFAIPGERYGVIQGLPFQKDDQGRFLVGADGNYLPGQDIEVIGDPNPNYTLGLINNLSWKGISFYMNWNYIDGGDIYSIMTATMLARGNTIDTDFDRFLPVIQPGVKPDGTENDIQGYIGDFAFRSYFFADEGAVFDATVIRLREIALSYELPASLLENTPFGAVSLRLSGENLFYNAPNFPEGVNYDPEVLSLGVGNGRGFEFVTGPTAKRYAGTISLTF